MPQIFLFFLCFVARKCKFHETVHGEGGPLLIWSVDWQRGVSCSTDLFWRQLDDGLGSGACDDVVL